MIHCTHCQTDSPAGSKYCQNCGQPLPHPIIPPETLPPENTPAPPSTPTALPPAMPSPSPLLYSNFNNLPRHLLLTIGLGLFLQLIVVSPFTNSPLGWLATWLFTTLVVFFPIGYQLNGEWPLFNIINHWLGKRDSLLRQISYTFLMSLVINLLVPRVTLDQVQFLFDTDQYLALARELLLAILQFLVTFIVVYFPISYWLTGQWPIWHQINRLLGDKKSPTRHISLALVLSLLFFLQFPAPPFVFPDSALPWLRGWFSWTLIFYVFIYYYHTGRWPLLRELRHFLGPPHTWRRRIFFTLLFTAPFYLALRSTIGLDYLVAISLVMFYLAGYAINWRATQNETHHVLEGLGHEVEGIKQSILNHVHQRNIPQLTVEADDEMGYGLVATFTFTIDARETPQNLITHDKALVILRVLPYGNDLYVRWESFYDLSSRRMWLILGLIYSIINGLSVNWVGNDAYTIMMNFRNILFGRVDPTLNRPEDNPPFDVSMFSTIPSYMIDNLYALEESVTQSVQLVLNEAAKQAGRDSNIELTINRHQGQRRLVF